MDIFKELKSIKYMSEQVAKLFQDIIDSNKVTNCLEVGTYKGAGTCYMAHFVSKYNGKVTTIDINDSTEAKENAKRLNLNNIEFISSSNGSAWELDKLLQQNKKYGLIYIDGSHEFNEVLNDFYLSDKLIEDNGTIVFDDYLYSWKEILEQDIPKKDYHWIVSHCEEIGKEKAESRQIMRVVQLVSKYHNYDITLIKNQAFCKKISNKD